MTNVTLPTMNWPLSGPVSETLFPWTNNFTVDLGQSSDADTEKAVIANVASYGRQLGLIGDALCVLLQHLPRELKLDRKEEAAIIALTDMLNRIANQKERRGRQGTIRPPPVCSLAMKRRPLTHTQPKQAKARGQSTQLGTSPSGVATNHLGTNNSDSMISA